MARRFPSGGGGASSGGGVGGAGGKYNETEMWLSSGTYTWTTPSNIDTSVAARIWW